MGTREWELRKVLWVVSFGGDTMLLDFGDPKEVDPVLKRGTRYYRGS